ncbi:MAG: hypothetical protein MOGMAGMI_00352 [Candidatus Omnitrophica bacterium]|nr:hypothetical protein [Candidatus Omnitrophota bacterium]
MITSKKTIEKIRAIINKHYNRVISKVLGKSLLDKKELEELKEAGYETSNDSFLEVVYNHNFINKPNNPLNPTSWEEMVAQQKAPGVVPQGEAHGYSIETLNESLKQYIEKQKLEIASRIEGIVRKNNDSYKMDALKNLDRPEYLDLLMKESSLSKIKQELRDTAANANYDWQRLVLTEMGNAVGIGSVDRIVSDNRDKDLTEVFVYRIPVNDDKTCVHCRKFYNNPKDNTYKIYRLSTLLSNGSNYGRKTEQWLPVIGSTHPNSRTSPIVEIPPGYKIKTGGGLTYIGMDKWKDYILQNLES